MSETIAIITGAGRGIGRATAIRLSQDGYRCVLVSRSETELRETAAACATESLVVPADVCRPEQVAAVVEKTIARFGRIDALINNAGSAPLVSFDQMTEAIWQETIETNLTSVFRFSRAVWPTMVAQQGGVIVSVSSESSRDPFPGFTAYAAAKAGVNLFTRALAKEGAAHQIRVHAVAPASVETAMLRKIISADQLPSDQLLRPEDVAATIRGCICGDVTHSSGETIYVHK